MFSAGWLVSIQSVTTHLIATMGGIGKLPAPGTMASIATAVLYYFVLANIAWYIQLVILALSILFFIAVCSRVSAQLGKHDPSEIVIDEFAGMWLALVFTPSSLLLISLQFVLFRLLDIAKPGPVGWADTKISGGTGIMLDDVIAGLLCMPIGLLLAWLIPDADGWLFSLMVL